MNKINSMKEKEQSKQTPVLTSGKLLLKCMIQETTATNQQISATPEALIWVFKKICKTTSFSKIEIKEENSKHKIKFYKAQFPEIKIT